MKSFASRFRYGGSAAVFAVGLAVGLLSPLRLLKDGGDRSGDPAQGPAGHGADRRNDRTTGVGPPSGTAANAAARPLPAADSEEFATAMQAIFRQPIESQRRMMFEKLLERATPEHLARMADLIRENDARDFAKSTEWSQLWAHWGDRDALGALQFAAAKDWSGWGNGVAEQAKRPAMLHLAATDPQAAVRYLKQCGDLEKGDRSMVYPLVRGWADQDPQAAADWAFKSGLAMAGEYRAVVDSLRRNKGDTATDAWFEQMAYGGVPAKDLPGLARALVAQRIALAPEKAADWVEAHAREPWISESEAVSDTTRAYAARDPQAAMNWAERTALPEAASEAFTIWCGKDVPAAVAWLDSHQDSPNFQQAAMTVAQALATRDPEAGKRMAERIPDNDARNQVLQVIDAMQQRNESRGTAKGR